MSKKESAARVMAKDLIAGCFGGIGIVAAGHPFDILPFSQLSFTSIGLQTQKPENPLYKGMMDCVKKTIKWEGLGGFYKGFISPLWGNDISSS